MNKEKEIAVIGGGSGGFGKSQLMFDIAAQRNYTIEQQLRGDVHMGMMRERPKGNNSFRHLDTTVCGVPGAAAKRAKRKAQKKARKQSRK